MSTLTLHLDRRPIRLRALAAGVTAVAAFGAPALAQEYSQQEPTEVAPITVIGQQDVVEPSSDKVTAPVLDMPQTIAVIPQEVFDAQGARNLTDILANTPGITFNAGENGFSTGLANFSLRGFDTSGSILTDGVRDSGSFNRDAFNIEQVEVFKGASGDAGRGGPGGYVNVVTRTPGRSDFYRIGLGFGFDETGADDSVRLTADINHVLSPTMTARVNLLLEGGGVPGRVVAERETIGIAPSFAWGLGTGSRLTVALQYVEQDDIPDYGVPAAFIDGMLQFDPTLDGEPLRDVFYGLDSDFDDVTSKSARIVFDHALTDTIDWSTQLRLSSTDRNSVFTVPTGYAAATRLVTTQRQFYARDNQSVSLISGLNGQVDALGVTHDFAAGVEWMREEADARSFATQTNPGTGAPVSVFAPNPARTGAFTGVPTEVSSVEVDTIAAYVNDTITLSSNWELTGGLRLEQYDVSIASRTVAGVPTGADGLDISEFTVSGRLGAIYKPAPDISLYGSIGVSSLPPASFLSGSDISRGGDNAFPGFSVGINSENADVQQSINYELGGKWEAMGGDLLLSGALFRTERHNVAVTGRPTVTDPVQLLGYGEQIVQGVELGVTGQITPRWSIFGGLLVMESERRQDAALDLGRCRANPGDFGVASAAACTAANRTDGDQLAFSPELSATLWTSYAFDLGLTVGGGVRYTDATFVGRPDDAERIIPNGIAGELPSWWVINTMAEYRLTPNALVRLNVDNITDEFYAVSTNWPAARVQLGAPRSFLLSLRMAF